MISFYQSVSLIRHLKHHFNFVWIFLSDMRATLSPAFTGKYILLAANLLSLYKSNLISRKQNASNVRICEFGRRTSGNNN